MDKYDAIREIFDRSRSEHVKFLYDLIDMYKDDKFYFRIIIDNWEIFERCFK